MMILTLFIYSAQRVVKEALIVPYLGAELISTIKLWGVLPSAVLIMLLYVKLCDFFKKTELFHFFNAFFISYFLYFTFFINPKINRYQLDLRVLKNFYPCLKYLFVMLENWSYSLYYIFSELWGSVMLALMFWQIANQVFSVFQAKRLYPLFGLFGQLGMLLSGYVATICTNQSLAKNWQESLNMINILVAIAGVLLSLLFYILYSYVVGKNILNLVKEKKKKIGFIASIKHVASSKYLALITIVILCYGVSINLVEGVWKAQVRLLYINQQSYASFIAKLQSYTGKVSMLAMGIGSYILNFVSWRFAALLTPLAILLSGSIFYIFSIYQNEISGIITISPMTIAVISGFIQNVMSKATKYAFFDATKEIAYIPLDDNLKSKGKAAADIIGGRLGKSGGAVIQWIMLLVPGTSLISISPVLSLVFITVMFIWFISVNLLAKEFYRLSKY
jgi:AAA family ATP:ADP antiporter